MRNYISYILLAFTLTSCTVTVNSVNVELLVPSAERISLNNDERIMVVANYRGPHRLLQGHTTAFVEDSIQVTNTVNGFNDYFRSLGAFSQGYVRSSFNQINKQEVEPLTIDDIDRYARLENPKYIVNLAMMRTLIKRLDPTTYKATYASLWQVYDVQSKSIVREILAKDSLYYDQYEKVSREELDSIISVDVAGRVAQHVGYTLLPYWEEQSRYFLTVFDPQFQKVEQLVREFRWKEVISLMEKFLTYPDKDFTYAATFNISLACEMLGDVELAKKWLEKSKSIKKSYVNTNYEQMLLLREMRENTGATEQ